jgi:hypothetical protein
MHTDNISMAIESNSGVSPYRHGTVWAIYSGSLSSYASGALVSSTAEPVLPRLQLGFTPFDPKIAHLHDALYASRTCSETHGFSWSGRLCAWYSLHASPALRPLTLTKPRLYMAVQSHIFFLFSDVSHSLYISSKVSSEKKFYKVLIMQ